MCKPFYSFHFQEKFSSIALVYPLPLCFESSRGVLGMMGLLFKPPHLHFPGRFFFVVASTMKFHGSYHLFVFLNFKWCTLYTFLQKLCHYFWNYIFCEYVFNNYGSFSVCSFDNKCLTLVTVPTLAFITYYLVSDDFLANF